MCRILYALNQPNIKSKINSFLLQSTDEPKAIDGHGFAGFDSTTRKWRVNKSSKPASNKTQIADTFAEYPLVIGHLRNAQIVDVPKSVIDGVLSASPKNTHPFYHKNHVFMHNGRFDDAHLPSMRQWFQANILPEYWQHVKGNTDSECIFYLLLSIIKRREWIYKDIDMLEGKGCKSPSKSEELRDAVRECFQLLDSKFHLYIANFIYADKDYSIVGRLRSIDAQCDSKSTSYAEYRCTSGFASEAEERFPQHLRCKRNLVGKMEKNATAEGKLVDSLYMALPSQRKNQLLFTTEPLDKTQNYELVNWGTVFVINNETAEYSKYRI